MIIIEIHVDNQENQTASTRTTQNREAASVQPTTDCNRWWCQAINTIKAWLAATKENNFTNNGF